MAFDEEKGAALLALEAKVAAPKASGVEVNGFDATALVLACPNPLLLPRR